MVDRPRAIAKREAIQLASMLLDCFGATLLAMTIFAMQRQLWFADF